MRYIRAIRLDGYGASDEHVSHVCSSIGVGGALSLQTREEIVRQIALGTQRYRSRNGTGHDVDVAVRVSSSGIQYISASADQRATNNLLSLPRF